MNVFERAQLLRETKEKFHADILHCQRNAEMYWEGYKIKYGNLKIKTRIYCLICCLAYNTAEIATKQILKIYEKA